MLVESGALTNFPFVAVILDDIIKRHRKEQTDAKAAGDGRRQQTKNRNLAYGFGRPRFRAWMQRNLQGMGWQGWMRGDPIAVYKYLRCCSQWDCLIPGIQPPWFCDSVGFCEAASLPWRTRLAKSAPKSFSYLTPMCI